MVTVGLLLFLGFNSNFNSFFSSFIAQKRHQNVVYHLSLLLLKNECGLPFISSFHPHHARTQSTDRDANSKPSHVQSASLCRVHRGCCRRACASVAETTAVLGGFSLALSRSLFSRAAEQIQKKGAKKSSRKQTKQKGRCKGSIALLRIFTAIARRFSKIQKIKENSTKKNK